MQKLLYILIGLILVLAAAGVIWFKIVINQPSPVQGVPSNNGTFGTPDNSPIGSLGAPQGSTNITTTPNQGVDSTGTSSALAPQTITIPMINGQTVVVKNFIQNGETVSDVVNPGYYYLAGSIGYCLGDGSCPSGYQTDDFTITYHTSDGLFNIELTKEPLGQSRAEAELFLRDRLGLEPAKICNLNYWIGVTDSLNTVYSGRNLGFSFCPGATAL